jgi:phage tail protein X
VLNWEGAMKRSESVLVYAVTAVLAVILVVAVVFGNEAEVRADADDVAVGQDLGARLDDFVGGGPTAQGKSAEGGDRPDGRLVGETADPPAPGPDGPTVVDGPAQYPGTAGPLRRDASLVPLAELLGEFELERQFDGSYYRLYRVVRGDTFSALVERWTGGLENLGLVRALNEEIDPDALKEGQLLRFPLVDDAELRAAHAARQAPRSDRRAPFVAPAPAPAPGRAAGTAVLGADYEIQRGESLWSIAEKQVGVRQAEAYVRAILAANPRIQDASRVRAGDRITLPPTAAQPAPVADR